MAKTYKSEAFAALHESVTALYRAGAIDKKTMLEFDQTCLIPAAIRPNAESDKQQARGLTGPRSKPGRRSAKG